MKLSRQTGVRRDKAKDIPKYSDITKKELLIELEDQPEVSNNNTKKELYELLLGSE